MEMIAIFNREEVFSRVFTCVSMFAICRSMVNILVSSVMTSFSVGCGCTYLVEMGWHHENTYTFNFYLCRTTVWVHLSIWDLDLCNRATIAVHVTISKVLFFDAAQGWWCHYLRRRMNEKRKYLNKWLLFVTKETKAKLIIEWVMSRSR